MKKAIILFAMFLVMGFSFTCGYYIYKVPKIKQEQVGQDIENGDKQIQVSKFEETDNEEDIETVETINQEEKVSPNAVLIIRKHYKSCEHTTNDEAVIPEDMVNKTKQEIEKEYSNWEVKEFSKDKVVLYKELEGICKEHYVLRPLDNVIAVYRINDKNEEVLEQKTGIAIQYLPQPDLIKLNNGIKATGKEELNSILEDYE